MSNGIDDELSPAAKADQGGDVMAGNHPITCICCHERETTNHAICDKCFDEAKKNG